MERLGGLAVRPGRRGLRRFVFRIHRFHDIHTIEEASKKVKRFLLGNNRPVRLGKVTAVKIWQSFGEFPPAQ